MDCIIPTDGPIYYVATNESSSVVHHGVTQVGQQTETGLPYCKCLATEEDYIVELAKHGITPDII